MIDSNGRLGTMTSSARFKDAIKPMGDASDVLLQLKPVTFRYKKELDPYGTPQFGLVAEEVVKIAPNLVARDGEGKVNTVRYEAMNAMLLNEFLKEHQKVEQQARELKEQEVTIEQLKKDLQATAAQQREQIEALTAGLQKVSRQLEACKFAPQLVSSNR